MTGQRRGTTIARRALWFTGVLILVAGILGMHGLSSHAGGMSPEMHPITPVHAVSGVGAPTPDVQDVVITGVRDIADSTTAVAVSLVQDLSVGDMGVTAMCIAVLAVALTMLLRFMGDVPALRPFRWATTLARAPTSHGRDPDPPSLILLSIQRC